MIKDRLARSSTFIDVAVALAIALTLFAFKARTLTLPYHWDEMGAYISPVIHLSRSGPSYALFGFSPGPRFFGHPPLLFVPLATLFALLGPSILVAHLYVLVWASITLWYTYRLGWMLFGRAAGLLAALFLFVIPLFFAQAGLFLGDLPIAALGLMAVYYGIRERYAWSCLFAALAVLTKETAVAFPVALLLYTAWTRKTSSRSARPALWYTIPLIVLTAFFVWQRLATGQWVANPYFNSNPMGTIAPAAVFGKAVWVTSWTLLHQCRPLFLLLIVLALLRCRGDFWRRPFWLFLLITVFFLSAFSLIYFGNRYILPLLPLLTIPAAGALSVLVPSRSGRACAGGMIALAFVPQWHGEIGGYGSYDQDMQYTDVIAIHQQAADFLQHHYPDAHIAATWPLRPLLAYPVYGYVQRPLDTDTPPAVVQPQHASPSGGPPPASVALEGFDLAFWAPSRIRYGPTYPNPLDAPDFSLLRIFEQRGKVLYLFARRTNPDPR